MKKTVLVCVFLLAGASAVYSQPGKGGGPKKIHEHLDGYAETPLALSTPGKGQFHARIDGNRIAWELSYADLGSPVTQAHIHFGSPSQAGGISVFLCTNLGNGPAGQGIAAGEFAELVRAIRADSTYVNVHTETIAAGEIRAQIHHGPPGHHKH